MKIVYNACYGGFGLSEEAIMRYAEIKGVTLYPEKEKWSTTYWTKPKSNIVGLLEGDAFYAASQEERVLSNRLHKENTIGERDFDRHDPILVQVVEELGDKASGDCAKLEIYETDSRMYRIDEYDGFESVATSYADDDWIVV